MLTAIDGIRDSMVGKSIEDYSHDWLLKHGVERGIEIISEASRRLPIGIKGTRPEVPWKQIAAIGNILRHNYDSIADRVIYDAVVHDLPPLRIAVVAMLANLDEPDT